MGIKTISFLLFTVLGINMCYAQQEEDFKIKKIIGLELGQAVFNDFRSYSGEVGIRLRNNHTLRLVHMNIKLSEAHLSSDFAVVVDGDHVEGEQFGFEAFYDIAVFREWLLVSPSVGWYSNEYQHVILEEGFKKESVTIGAAISVRERDIFGIQGLYYTVSLPLRLPLSPFKKTILGDTIIKSNTLDSNIFFFIGLEF